MKKLYKAVYSDLPEPLVEGIISDVDPVFNMETFTKLVNDALDLEHEDNPTYKKLEDFYGSKVAEALVMWLQQQGGDLNGTDNNNLTSEQVFQLIQDLPTGKAVQVLQRSLGGGASGVAVQMKGNKVIKKLFKDFKYQDNAKFYEYCLKKKPDVFLKVLRIGKDYIVSEWVDSPSAKCRQYAREINKAIDKAYEEKAAGKFPKGVDVFDAGSPMVNLIEDPEVREWAIKVDNHLVNIQDAKIGWGDIKSTNLGETKDGKIVLIDP